MVFVFRRRRLAIRENPVGSQFPAIGLNRTNTSLMSENDSEKKSFFQLILNSLLILFTVLGGYLFVSKKLTTERPSANPVNRSGTIGEQKLEARLWEDPFQPELEGSSAAQSLSNLTNQIAIRSIDTNRVLLLPVMIPGGPYSEDQESRIRSRFAIISALGRMGYVPEDSEQIGNISIDWPTKNSLRLWAANVLNTNISLEPFKNTRAAESEKDADGKASLIASLKIGTGYHLSLQRDAEPGKGAPPIFSTINFNIRYEWHEKRSFAVHSTNKFDYVLVLWLEDGFFEDDPLLRIPLLLKPLLDVGTNRNNPLEAHFIGPRRSGTLRAMLREEYERGNIHWLISTNGTNQTNRNESLFKEMTNCLGKITLFSATPNAMDEVLVKGANDVPREGVSKALKARGFKDALFYNSSDSQMAYEIFEELKLRNCDLKWPTNHLVLLSEWDTFYGRMLSLTYAATLNDWTTRSNITNTMDDWINKSGSLSNFVSNYTKDQAKNPTNFHSFVYLRGLDGRTVTGKQNSSEKGDLSRKRLNTESVQEVLSWTPDANKAEGQGQFDYLRRASEYIEKLQNQLKPKQTYHKIKAVGIVGSDLYDTLLILQALRDKFPDVYFFTTDLDARMWHTSELHWTRNLIVASSYGLSLHPDLQKEIPPFRDSSQTAQYAAAMAALGETNLQDIAQVNPRRFEIGNSSAIDLSVQDSFLSVRKASPSPRKESLRLHPETREESGKDPALCFSFYAGLIILPFIILMFFWTPYLFRSPENYNYFTEHLQFFEADIGGEHGSETLLRKLELQRDDPFCQWFYEELNERSKSEGLFPLSVQEKSSERRELRMKLFVQLLNEILHRNPKLNIDQKMVQKSKMFDGTQEKARPWENAGQSWRKHLDYYQRYRNREMLGKFLEKLGGDNASDSFVNAASGAREAALKLFRARFLFLGFVLVFLVVFVCRAAFTGDEIYKDTFKNSGEPFSLISGVSSWPNLLLRSATAWAAFFFIFVFFVKMYALYYEISRKYRIPIDLKDRGSGIGSVCVSQLWNQYRKTGKFGRRMLIAGSATFLYYGFGYILLTVFGFPFEPVRGKINTDLALPFSFPFPWHPFVIFSILLSFLTIGAATRMRQFILSLSSGSTDYSESTRAHFQSLRGDIVRKEYLDEWIDTQLIADMTEKVGRLFWLPGIAFLLMVSSLIDWTDNWPSSTALNVLLVMNFCLSVSSVVILQLAARNAKLKSVESLSAKVKKAQAKTAVSVEHNDAAQAEKLLYEIQSTRRGAFSGFWESPVAGALLLAPGGTALIHVVLWLVQRH